MKFRFAIPLLALMMPLKAEKTINISAFNYAPYTMDPNIKENKGKIGFVNEIYKKVFKAKGYKVNIEFMNYPRSIKNAETGVTHAVGILNPTTSKKVHLPKLNVAVLTQKFWVRKNDSWKWSNISSLKKMRIGNVNYYNYSIINDDYQKYLTAKENQERVFMISGEAPDLRNLKLITMNRIDTFNESAERAGFLMRTHNLSSKIKEAGLLGVAPIYIGFYKDKNEYYKTLANDFDDGFQALHKSGELKKILDKYEVEPYNIKFRE